MDELEYEYQLFKLENDGEGAAEEAWLRAAEAPTADDLAFEAWERGRGVY